MKTLSDVAISVLDLAKVPDGKSIGDTYAASKELAQHVEALGYKRFWLAEHHNLAGIASAATSILIGFIAENTKTIRVGSGGIMLPNHAPIVIAEQFGTLESLYPGRIDLGLGRAPGTDRATMRAVRRYHSYSEEVDFSDMIDELVKYFAPANATQQVRAIPGAGIQVPIYILGSSLYSALLAARLGRPYAFAGHFAPGAMMQAYDTYRKNFKPSEYLQKPYVIAGVPVVAAESDERAEYLATSIQQAFLGMVRGNRKFSQPPVKDMDAIWSESEKSAVGGMLQLMVTGGPEKVRRELDRFIQATDVDELVITSDTYEWSDRLKSYDYISRAKRL